MLFSTADVGNKDYLKDAEKNKCRVALRIKKIY